MIQSLVNIVLPQRMPVTREKTRGRHDQREKRNKRRGVNREKRQREKGLGTTV